MVNARIGKTAPNTRNRSMVVNVKISAGPIQTTSMMTTNFGGPGYLMGMMALTYTKSNSTTNSVTSGGKGQGPSVRITTF